MLSFQKEQRWTLDPDLCCSSIFLQLEVSGLVPRISFCLFFVFLQFSWWPNVCGLSPLPHARPGLSFYPPCDPEGSTMRCCGHRLTRLFPPPVHLCDPISRQMSTQASRRDQQHTKLRISWKFNLVDCWVWLGLQEYRWRVTYRNLSKSKTAILPMSTRAGWQLRRARDLERTA